MKGGKYCSMVRTKRKVTGFTTTQMPNGQMMWFHSSTFGWSARRRKKHVKLWNLQQINMYRTSHEFVYSTVLYCTFRCAQGMVYYSYGGAVTDLFSWILAQSSSEDNNIVVECSAGRNENKSTIEACFFSEYVNNRRLVVWTTVIYGTLRYHFDDIVVVAALPTFQFSNASTVL